MSEPGNDERGATDTMSPESETGGEENSLSWAERYLAIYFHDSTLWPVAIVAMAAVSTFGAALVLLAIFDRRIAAMGALAILIWLSFDRVKQEWTTRGFGFTCRLIAGAWLLTAIVAAVLRGSGLFA